ncbi:MAG: hypothetical protein U0Q03_20485 [Acidimicrobiales bacterium]
MRVFFAVIDKDPVAVTPADVLEFITVQRRGAGDGRVVRLADGGSGMAARTIRRRLASVSGLFNWLVLCDQAANPVRDGDSPVGCRRAVDRRADPHAADVAEGP